MTNEDAKRLQIHQRRTLENDIESNVQSQNEGAVIENNESEDESDSENDEVVENSESEASGSEDEGDDNSVEVFTQGLPTVQRNTQGKSTPLSNSQGMG